MMQMQKTNIFINFVSLSAFPHNTSTFEVLLILFLLSLSLSLFLSIHITIQSSAPRQYVARSGYAIEDRNALYNLISLDH